MWFGLKDFESVLMLFSRMRESNPILSACSFYKYLHFPCKQPLPLVFLHPAVLISGPFLWLCLAGLQQVAALPRYFGFCRVAKALHRKWFLLQNSSHPYHTSDLPLGENNVPKSPFYACFILSWCLLSYSTVKYVHCYCRCCCSLQSPVVV